MPSTYEPIATTTLGSTASGITFSSIPATYTDLRLVISLIPAAGTRANLQFNGDTGTNYSRTLVYADGSSALTIQTANASFISPNTSDITGVSLWTYDIFSYAGSTNKTALSTVSADANGSGWVNRGVHLWRSTSAINSIYVYFATANTFAAGTTATLYGIKNA